MSDPIHDLFVWSNKPPHAEGFATNIMVAHDNGKTKAVGLTVNLIDPKSKKPTDKSLFLQIQRADAVNLAKTILILAKAQNWEIPEATWFETSVGKGGKN